MDRKGIIALVVAFAGLLGLQWAANKIYPPIPVTATNTVAAATNRLVAGVTNPAAASIPNLGPTPQPPPTLLTAAEETRTLENDSIRVQVC
jgi:hypothetical protein